MLLCAYTLRIEHVGRTGIIFQKLFKVIGINFHPCSVIKNEKWGKLLRITFEKLKNYKAYIRVFCCNVQFYPQSGKWNLSYAELENMKLHAHIFFRIVTFSILSFDTDQIRDATKMIHWYGRLAIAIYLLPSCSLPAPPQWDRMKK